jgi:hypothetical protein
LAKTPLGKALSSALDTEELLPEKAWIHYTKPSKSPYSIPDKPRIFAYLRKDTSP